MNSFIAGRCLKVACRALANVGHGPRSPAPEELKSQGHYLESCLSKIAGRVFHVGDMFPPGIVFIDAAFEDSRATWGTCGIAAIGLRTGVREHKQKPLPSRNVCRPFLRNRLVTFYIGNESTRCAVITGSSPLRTLFRIVLEFLGCELGAIASLGSRGFQVPVT